tara:strand:- start:380 stop:697 length:318 start_codon:yes stop_codon:yes gene_type:complete
MSLAHQDWKPVVIHKKPDPKQQKKEEGAKKKPGHSLDDNKEEFKNKKISRDLSQEIIKRRCAMKLNRKQLAQQINVKEDIISKYETGQAIVDPKVLNKIKRKLKM